MKQLRTNNKTTSKTRKNKTLCSFSLRKSVILVKKIYPFCLPNKTIVCCLNNQYEINLKDFLNNKVFILVSSGIFNTCNITNQNRAYFCPSGMKSFLFFNKLLFSAPDFQTTLKQRQLLRTNGQTWKSCCPLSEADCGTSQMHCYRRWKILNRIEVPRDKKECLARASCCSDKLAHRTWSTTERVSEDTHYSCTTAVLGR